MAWPFTEAVGARPMWTEVVKVSLKDTMTAWLKHSLSSQLENHDQEIIFFFFFKQWKTKRTSATAEHEAKLLKSWASAESILSASMTWLVVNRRFMSMASFPESEELHTPSKTHISTGIFFFFFSFFLLKKGKTSLIPLKFLKCSLLLNASTTLEPPHWLRILVLFFAKWEVALSWKSSGVNMEVSQPNLVYYSHIAPPSNTSGYREKRKPEQTRINTGSIQLGEKKESWKGFEGNATQQMVITWTLKTSTFTKSMC